MKKISILFMVAFLSGGCCREYRCYTGEGITLRFNGFSPLELQDVKIYKFDQSGGFASPYDSSVYPYVFADSLSETQLTDFSADYMITVLNDTSYVSKLTYQISIFKSCSGAIPKMGACKADENYSVSGSKISKGNEQIIIQK